MKPKASKRSEDHPERRQRWTRTGLLWVLVLALAALLRSWRIGAGLPDFMEEAIPFRKALAMWGPDGSTDWNPHFFHHPSLTIYLHLFAQKLHLLVGRALGTFANAADYLVLFRIEPTPMAFLARSMGIAAGGLAVLYVGWIGERLRKGAGLPAALLATLAPSAIGVSEAITSDAVMIALMLAALERMLAYRARPGRARLLVSVVLIGLATGAKYPAAVTLLPLAWVLVERHGARGVAAWLACVAGALVVFLATTPYALLDPTFVRDLTFVGRLGVEGHFGSFGHSAIAFHVRNLARDIGWVGIALLPGSFALVAKQARSHGAAIAVWSLLLAFALPLIGAPVVAERYIVPVTLLAAPLVAAALLELTARLSWRARAVWVTLAIVAMSGAALITSGRRVAANAETTHAQARVWCEANLTRDDLLIQEFYGAALHSRLDAFNFVASPAYLLASEPVRARYAQKPWLSSVTLPLAVVGSIPGHVTAADSTRREIVAFEQAADLNPLFYDPRLFTGVDYVLTSHAVRARYQAMPERYAMPCRFYALLDSTAEVAARFPSHAAHGDPEIVIYRLGSRTQQALEVFGPLDPLWWAETVPRTYRERAEADLAPPLRSAGATRDALGEPAAWIASLDAVFDYRIAPFVRAMAMEHFEHGHPALSRRFADAVLCMVPQDVGTCLLYVNASRELGRWEEARAALERSIAALARGGPPSPWLALEYADALARDGEIDRARAEIDRVLASGDAYLIGEARRRLADPNSPLAVLR